MKIIDSLRVKSQPYAFTKKINYIGSEHFVKFSGSTLLSELTEETTKILKEHGIPSSHKLFPYTSTDGIIVKMPHPLLGLGQNEVGEIICVNTETDEIVLFAPDSKEIDIVNSSLKKYLECLFELKVFDDEIRNEETLGDYWSNHRKYAEKLKSMLIDIEPEIMLYSIWGNLVEEMELGVI